MIVINGIEMDNGMDDPNERDKEFDDEFPLAVHCSASVGADGRCMILTDWKGREIYLSRDEAMEMLEAVQSKIGEMAVKL